MHWAAAMSTRHSRCYRSVGCPAILGTAESAFAAGVDRGLHAAVQKTSPKNLQYLEGKVLFEGIMLCNTVFSCEHAVH